MPLSSQILHNLQMIVRSVGAAVREGNNMGIKKFSIAAGCTLSLNAIPGSMGSVLVEEYHPWSFIGALGYTW